MGDEKYIGEQKAVRLSAKSSTLESEVQDANPILIPNQEIVLTTPGITRRVLSRVYKNTVGRMYKPAEEFQGQESLDKGVNEAYEQAQKQESKLNPNISLRDGALVGGGIATYIVGTEVAPHVSGLLYTVGTAITEVSAPFVEVVLQNPSYGVGGAMVTPWALNKLMQVGRGKSLTKPGWVLGAATGAVVSAKYGADLVTGGSAILGTIWNYSPEILAAGLGAKLGSKLAGDLTKDENGEIVTWKNNTAHALGAGVASGLAAYTPWLVENGMSLLSRTSFSPEVLLPYFSMAWTTNLGMLGGLAYTAIISAATDEEITTPQLITRTSTGGSLGLIAYNLGLGFSAAGVAGAGSALALQKLLLAPGEKMSTRQKVTNTLVGGGLGMGALEYSAQISETLYSLHPYGLELNVLGATTLGFGLADAFSSRAKNKGIGYTGFMKASAKGAGIGLYTLVAGKSLIAGWEHIISPYPLETLLVSGGLSLGVVAAKNRKTIGSGFGKVATGIYDVSTDLVVSGAMKTLAIYELGEKGVKFGIQGVGAVKNKIGNEVTKFDQANKTRARKHPGRTLATLLATGTGIFIGSGAAEKIYEAAIYASTGDKVAFVGTLATVATGVIGIDNLFKKTKENHLEWLRKKDLEAHFNEPTSIDEFLEKKD